MSHLTICFPYVKLLKRTRIHEQCFSIECWNYKLIFTKMLYFYRKISIYSEYLRKKYTSSLDIYYFISPDSKVIEHVIEQVRIAYLPIFWSDSYTPLCLQLISCRIRWEGRAFVCIFHLFGRIVYRGYWSLTNIKRRIVFEITYPRYNYITKPIA